MRPRRDSSTRDSEETNQTPGPRTGRLRRGTERGATLVEYALLMAVLVVPTIAAIDYLQAGAEVKIQSTADGISTRTIPPVTTTAP